MADKDEKYTSLTKQLAAGFFICGIIPIVIIASTSIYTSKQLALKEQEVTATEVAKHRHDVINNFLEYQVELMSTLIQLYPLDYLKDQNNLNTLFLAAGSSGNLVDMQLVDTTGEQLAYVGPYADRLQGKNFREQTWFAEALVRGAYVSDLYTGNRKIPHFVIALTDPLKRYVLRATINSGVFNSLLHSAQIGVSGDVFIVNSRGELQTPSLQEEISTLNPGEKSLVRRHAGVELLRRGDYLYATSWLNTNDWLLILKVKVDEALELYYDHLRLVLLIIGITCIVFLVMAIALSKFIVAQIAKADREAAAIDQQMAHVEKMANIGRLAAGVAHEINNPLQMILAQAGWIEELLPEEDPAALKNLDEYLSTLQKIKHHVGRASTITHRLLGFARKINAEQESVQINAVVEETLSFLEKEAKHNNIAVNLHLDPQLPVTMTEGHRLQQVLLNLIENALDAVGHEGQVNISTSEHNGQIRIEIADNGPGIPDEVMKKIWDPFFTTKEQGKGTGLGLSISQNIIRTLGGTLEARNQQGKGAIFTVKVPINRPAGQSS